MTLASKNVCVGLEKWKATRNGIIGKVLNKIKALLHQVSNLCVIYLMLAVLAKSGSQINKFHSDLLIK